MGGEPLGDAEWAEARAEGAAPLFALRGEDREVAAVKARLWRRVGRGGRGLQRAVTARMQIGLRLFCVKFDFCVLESLSADVPQNLSALRYRSKSRR